MTKHVLYGAEISQFSGKARCYLRWKQVEFEDRVADATFFETICKPRIGYRMIPLLLTPNDEAIQDTTLIMDHFEANAAYPSFTPSTPLQLFAARLIELYADDWLLITAMHYRWEYDADATLLEFGMNLEPSKSKSEQKAIGKALGDYFSGAVPVLGVHPHNKNALERSYIALLKDLDAHFRRYPFLFGDRPSIGDFGLAGALYAHLYRDAHAGAVMRREALAVARFVERMMFPNGAALGEYLPDDDIPETLTPVFSRMMKEQAPCLAGTVDALARWRAEHPDDVIPRVIGFHDITVEGVTAQRAIFPYSAWMFDRAKEIYDTMDTQTKARADRFLAQCGGEQFAKTVNSCPMKLEDYHLQWAH